MAVSPPTTTRRLWLSFAADTNFPPAARAHRHSQFPSSPTRCIAPGQPSHKQIPQSPLVRHTATGPPPLPLQPSTIHTRDNDAEGLISRGKRLPPA
ncbi:hypothetical protein LX36DRAFT_650827 [Colletotrichum falcatum]|nr:hypothetical protein LX36DRAFT_650827 [Colletotrichum falcatum]